MRKVELQLMKLKEQMKIIRKRMGVINLQKKMYIFLRKRNYSKDGNSVRWCHNGSQYRYMFHEFAFLTPSRSQLQYFELQALHNTLILLSYIRTQKYATKYTEIYCHPHFYANICGGKRRSAVGLHYTRVFLTGVLQVVSQEMGELNRFYSFNLFMSYFWTF